MIEGGHLAAMQAAVKAAGESASRGDFEGAAIAALQIEAVKRIDEAGKRILAELGVPDITSSGQAEHVSPSFIPNDFISDGKKFGEQLRDYRHSTRLNGEQFRLITGLTPVSVCRYETGKQIPSIRVLLRTVNTLHMNRGQAEGFVQSAGFPTSILDAPTLSGKRRG